MRSCVVCHLTVEPEEATVVSDEGHYVCIRCAEGGSGRPRFEQQRPRRKSYDDPYCFYLFRRAIVDNDQHAWTELYEVYNDLVRSWCRKAVTSQSVDPEDLVAQAWERLWRYFGADKLRAASGTWAILKYLKLCAGSAAIDAMRAQAKSVPFDEALADVGPATSPSEDLLSGARQEAFWRLVRGHLKEEREYILLYLMYELGLKAADIQRRHPALFPTIKEVYSLTRNVHDRLKRSRELRCWSRSEAG